MKSDNFYNLDGGKTIYDEWLIGDEKNMTMPLGSRSSLYRKWLMDIFYLQIRKEHKILSIGSCLGILEKELQDVGYNILTCDNHPRAVEICKESGLESKLYNFPYDKLNLTEKIDIVYADGLLGHLYANDIDSDNIWLGFKKILSNRGKLILSNDLSDNDNLIWNVTGSKTKKFLRPNSGWFIEEASKFRWKCLYTDIFEYVRNNKKRQREVCVFSIGEQMDSIEVT